MKSIIFVHKGNPRYLGLAINQARIFNPNCDIILLGDDSNKSVEGACHFAINDYMKDANEFNNIFFNVSPNRRSYELFCFQRWFIIRDFFKSHPQYDDDFLYCDSDTLLYTDATYALDKMTDYLLATEAWESPGFSFFKKGTLDDFCKTITWMYSSLEGLTTVKYYANEFEHNDLLQGISDMTAFLHYSTKKRSGKCLDAQIPSTLWRNDKRLSCYDHNINMPDGFLTDMWNRKKIQFHDGMPYCRNEKTGENVLFNGLHFQGDAKYLMIKYQSTTRLNLTLLVEFIRGYLTYRLKIAIRWWLDRRGLSLRKK